MPENNSNKETHPTQAQLAQEVLETTREQLLQIGPDYEHHLVSDLGKIKMLYQLTIEEHEAETKARRLLANPPPGHDVGLLFKMKAADDRSTLNMATAWNRHEMEVANSLLEDE
jgi:hypothetical protein